MNQRLKLMEKRYPSLLDYMKIAAAMADECVICSAEKIHTIDIYFIDEETIEEFGGFEGKTRVIFTPVCGDCVPKDCDCEEEKLRKALAIEDSTKEQINRQARTIAGRSMNTHARSLGRRRQIAFQNDESLRHNLSKLSGEPDTVLRRRVSNNGCNYGSRRVTNRTETFNEVLL